ncbi:hypothetical protein ACLB2K_048511 [Fragaria x ananassa]
MVPVVNYEWLDTDFGVRLTWGKPDCRSCELSGRVCGFKNAFSLELDCSRQTYGTILLVVILSSDMNYVNQDDKFVQLQRFSGLSDATKFRLLTSVGIPGLVCITLIALYIFTLIRDRGRDRINEALTELSSVSSTNIPQIHVVITGLDDLTLESYPKIQLGEKWEIPDPDDSTCPIYSPFTFLTDIRNYTFLNCSAQDGTWAASISCLSDDYYKVLLVPTPHWPTSWFPCSIISTALVPIYSLQWRDLDDVLGIHLSWNEPDCRSCEAGGLCCEFQNATSSQVRCFGSSHTGLSGSAKYGIMMGVGIPGILCTLGMGLYVCDRVGRVRDGLHRRQSITELSTAVDQQVEPAPLVIVGLDGRTIESYPKLQLDESLELPEPDDKTCSICLCEYQPKETIRIIPDCNHYFHASCIYEWLRKNPTCPLCRNPPEGLLKL